VQTSPFWVYFGFYCYKELPGGKRPFDFRYIKRDSSIVGFKPIIMLFNGVDSS
jgi:hypothetical protein